MAEKRETDTKAVKAGTWYTVGNLLLKGCVFLTLPIFTRILTTADFGIYNTYIAYEQLLQAVLGLGLYGTVKNAKLDYEEKFEEYLSSVISFSLIFLFIIILTANLTYPLYAELTGFSRLVTNCLILQSFGSYLVYFYGAKLNIEFKYKSYIVLACFNTFGNIGISILLILFVFPNERYLGRIFGSALPLILISVFLCSLIICRGKKMYSKTYWKYALSIGLPLVPHVVAQSLLSQFDRIMISDMAGSSQSGIYSYIYTICTITYVLCTSLDSAWTPWVYIKLKSGNEESIKKSASNYILLFAVLTLGFICVMPEITKWIADSEYWDGIDLIVPLSLANYCIFLYMLPVGIEYYHKKTKYISLGTILSALFNLLLNYAVIGVFGYKAAAYTTLISYMALFIFHWLFAGKLNIKEIYDFKNILIISGVLFALSFVILYLSRFGMIDIIVRYSAVAFILVGMFLKRDVVIRILKKEDK